MTIKRFSIALAREIPADQQQWNQISPETIVNLCGDAKELVDTFVGYIGEGPSTDKLTASKQILRYLKVQVDRLSSWAEGPADLNALVHRNLIELDAWTSHIAASNENAGRFCTEFVFELFEFGQKWMKSAAAQPTGILAELYKALCVVQTGKRSVTARSRIVEDSNYESCSKLIHPSSLIINNPEFLKNVAIQRNCQVNALLLTERICTKIFDVIKANHDENVAEIPQYSGSQIISFGT